MRKYLQLSGALVLFLMVGCASQPVRTPLPVEYVKNADEYVKNAEMQNLPDARFWADTWPTYSRERVESYTEDDFQKYFSAIYQKPHNYLAISGGGADGAYGAGLLVGWTRAATRPDFTMVTGVSTGALTAPFAFLGSKYDDTLKKVYTTTSTEDIVEKESIVGIIFKLISGAFKGAISDNKPFQKTIAKYMTDQVIDEIAVEHRRGRRLYIGTFNLDASRSVIWNIGAIAVSDHPRKVTIIREVMRASASIPIAFPSVLIPIEVNGTLYDELHVDGGLGSQVFVYPAAVDWSLITKVLQVQGIPKVYVIRNSSFGAEYLNTKQGVISIASRSIDSLLRSQGIGDLYKIYALCERDGNEFNLASIPSSFDEEATEIFDPEYMGKLFDLGYQRALKGYTWEKVPPNFSTNTTQELN